MQLSSRPAFTLNNQKRLATLTSIQSQVVQCAFIADAFAGRSQLFVNEHRHVCEEPMKGLRVLRRMVQMGGVLMVLLLAPSIMLKVCRLPIPHICVLLTAAAVSLIPVEIALIGGWFCTVMVLMFVKGLRARSCGRMLTTTLMFTLGCLLAGYVLRLAVMAMWTRR
jgi:hypothetical protein